MASLSEISSANIKSEPQETSDLAPCVTNNAGVLPINDRPPFVHTMAYDSMDQMWATLPISTQKIDVSSKKC